MIKQKENKFYFLGNDIIFKNVFNGFDTLKRLLEETLNLKINDIFQSNTELGISNIQEKKKYLDLILETNQGIINVEVNFNNNNQISRRNLVYFCTLLSKSIKKSGSYVNIPKHIQLNITWGIQKFFYFDLTNTKVIKLHIADDKTHHLVYEDIFEIIHINMDYYRNVWYHGDVRNENPFLMLLAAESIEEMDKISEGDDFMKKLSDKVKKLNEDPNILDVIIENEDEIINQSIFDQGVKEGIEQGMEQGIEQKQIEIAKNLLNNGIDTKIIIKCTGLSKEELEKL